VAKARATSWVLSPISAMNTKKRAIKKGDILFVLQDRDETEPRANTMPPSGESK
jgi:hypothetical protein